MFLPGLFIYVPYDPSHREPSKAADKLFSFAKRLAALDSACGDLRLHGKGESLADLEAVPAEWANALVRDQFVTRLSTRSGPVDRSVKLGAGSARRPTNLTIEASIELMSDEPRVLELLAESIRFWSAGEASVATLWHDRSWRFWQRWLQGSELLHPALPLEPTWTERGDWEGGTLHTWSGHRPRQVIAELEAHGRA